MDLRRFNVTVRRFHPESNEALGDDLVLPVDSPDEEHAASAAMSNAIAFTTKVQDGKPLPVAFQCVGVSARL